MSTLIVPAARAAELDAASLSWPSYPLEGRQLDLLELMLTGTLGAQARFHSAAETEAILDRAQLPDGTPWPVPLLLDVPEDLAATLEPGSELGLRDAEGVLLAAVHVSSTFAVPAGLARALAGESLVAAGRRCVAGSISGLRLPTHHDWTALREPVASSGPVAAAWLLSDVPAQPLVEAALSAVSGPLLLLGVAPSDQALDDRFHSRVRCWRLLAATDDRLTLALTPASLCPAPDRQAAWSALIAAGYSADSVLVDGSLVDHPVSSGTAVPARPLPPVDPQLPAAEMRRRLAMGEGLPEWYGPAQVRAELQRFTPPRSEQGLTVMFSGLSGSGKSTVANALAVHLLESGERRITLLDGDVVRHHLSAGLGFSKKDRDLNVRRIGWVAAQIASHGGMAICAPIAPYDETRRAVRAMSEAVGGFVLVHVATPLEECERRDRKGLYAKARAGLIPEFTGISDPYEVPTDAELVVDTTGREIGDVLKEVLDYLVGAGWLRAG